MNDWCYRRAGHKSLLAYAEKVKAGYLYLKQTPIQDVHTGEERLSEQVRITPLGLLVWKCLMIRPIPVVFNEPKNLLDECLDEYSFDEICKFQLEHVQDGIQEAGVRNKRVADNLSRVRLAAVISPMWFLVAFGFHWWGPVQTVVGAG